MTRPALVLALASTLAALTFAACGPGVPPPKGPGPDYEDPPPAVPREAPAPARAPDGGPS